MLKYLGGVKYQVQYPPLFAFYKHACFNKPTFGDKVFFNSGLIDRDLQFLSKPVCLQWKVLTLYPPLSSCLTLSASKDSTALRKDPQNRPLLIWRVVTIGVPNLK